MTDLKKLIGKRKMTFAEARDGAQQLVSLIKEDPASKEGWLTSLNYFLSVMDARSLNGFSLEAQEFRKSIGGV